MKAEPLTERQADAMRFIQQRIGKRGVAPSHAELMEALAVTSKQSVSRVLDQLVERGYLKRDPRRARHLTIVRRLPGDMEGDARAIAARLRIDARKLAEGPEREGMLTAAKHYAAIASGCANDRRQAQAAPNAENAPGAGLRSKATRSRGKRAG